MKSLSPEEQTVPRTILGGLLAWGFLITCTLAYRDARLGCELRVQNESGQPIEVYLIREMPYGTQTTHLFDVWASEISRSYVLKRDEAGELVFAPRGTGRRIARIELPGDVRKAVRRPDASLLVKLYPSHHNLSDGSELDIPKVKRVPPEAPLLYVGTLGWLLTFNHFRRYIRRNKQSQS